TAPSPTGGRAGGSGLRRIGGRGSRNASSPTGGRAGERALRRIGGRGSRNAPSPTGAGGGGNAPPPVGKGGSGTAPPPACGGRLGGGPRPARSRRLRATRAVEGDRAVGFAAQELAHQRILAGLQFVGRAVEDDAAVGHHHRAVGDRQGLVHVVGDDDAGQAEAVV